MGSWYETPLFEGSGPIRNADAAYYDDPAKYFAESILVLVNKGAKFLTWSEVIRDQTACWDDGLYIILQHDVDGGPKSMERLLRWELVYGIKSSILMHRFCTHWYQWRMEDLDLDLYMEAESRGWEIGYHQNTLSNIAFSETSLVDVYENLPKYVDRATKQIRGDVKDLRRHFDIKIYSPHGGLAPNSFVSPPDECNIVWVHNKTPNRHLWKNIRAGFSDGGFTMKPKPLRQFVDSLDRGIYFILCHPVKYGNWNGEPDFLPRKGSSASDEYGRLENEWADLKPLKRRFYREQKLGRLGIVYPAMSEKQS